MKVRFLGHAGLLIQQGRSTIALDPWFTSSHFETPILSGLPPSQRTIDFQIFKTRDDVYSVKPDGVFCSHLHTHHAPLDDIQILLGSSLSSNPVLGLPKCPPDLLQSIKERMGSISDRIQICGMEPFENVKIGELTITAFASTQDRHLAWYVKSNDGAILHVIDSPIHENMLKSEISEVWEPMRNLKPDILFITAGGTSSKRQINDAKVIFENACMSPIQGARFAKYTNCRAACPIGFYNFSIWHNREETTLPFQFVEQQFDWALQYLAPEIRSFILRPGDEFSVRPNSDVQFIHR